MEPLLAVEAVAVAAVVLQEVTLPQLVAVVEAVALDLMAVLEVVGAVLRAFSIHLQGPEVPVVLAQALLAVVVAPLRQ
jgi:hypothetical protein